jgi:hypothetical protein
MACRDDPGMRPVLGIGVEYNIQRNLVGYMEIDDIAYATHCLHQRRHHPALEVPRWM